MRGHRRDAASGGGVLGWQVSHVACARLRKVGDMLTQWVALLHKLVLPWGHQVNRNIALFPGHASCRNTPYDRRATRSSWCSSTCFKMLHILTHVQKDLQYNADLFDTQGESATMLVCQEMTLCVDGPLVECGRWLAVCIASVR